MAYALEIQNLVKKYDSVLAVDDVSFYVNPGEVFGLLGPNGAGKTSIISILTTLEKPTAGRALVFDREVRLDSRDTKYFLGVVPQEVVSHGFFSVEEVLRFHAGYYGIRKPDAQINYLIERLGLGPHRKKVVRQLSGGMKRRLLIAKALVHEPKVLLLDEPTAGVDIALRDSLWEFVVELRERGTSILLTTHYLQEAEELCNRVAIIHQGKIKGIGVTKDLVRDLTTKEVVLMLHSPLPSFTHPRLVSQEGTSLTFRVPNDAKIGELIHETKIPLTSILDIRIQEGSLEDAFVHMVWDK